MTLCHTLCLLILFACIFNAYEIVAYMYTTKKEHWSNNTGMHGGTQLNKYNAAQTYMYILYDYTMYNEGGLPPIRPQL